MITTRLAPTQEAQSTNQASVYPVHSSSFPLCFIRFIYQATINQS